MEGVGVQGRKTKQVCAFRVRVGFQTKNNLKLGGGGCRWIPHPEKAHRKPHALSPDVSIHRGMSWVLAVCDCVCACLCVPCTLGSMP